MHVQGLIDVLSEIPDKQRKVYFRVVTDSGDQECEATEQDYEEINIVDLNHYVVLKPGNK